MNEEREKKLNNLFDKKEDLIWELMDTQINIANLFEEEAKEKEGK